MVIGVGAIVMQSSETVFDIAPLSIFTVLGEISAVLNSPVFVDII